MIDETETSAHGSLPFRLIDHHEVHELRHTGIAGASGSLIFRNDEIGQNRYGLIFMWREEFRLKRCAALGSLTYRGLRPALRCFDVGGCPGNRSGNRPGGEELQDSSTRYWVHISHTLSLLRS